MGAKGHWVLEELGQLNSIASHMYTLLAFMGSLILIPTCAVSYLVVQTSQNIWLNILQKKFPYLEFVRASSLRTTIDTHRNQGIISLLLQVRGKCDPNLITQKLQENVLDRRRGNGELFYPHLRTPLTTKWGRYAWQKSHNFNIGNHVNVANSAYRGRVVTELNIQEYVSEIVSKYLPPEFSPWQLTIIPSSSSQGEIFYLLIRIHHLLLSEDRVGLGDLLLLRDEKSPLRRRLGEDDENFVSVHPDPYEPLIQRYAQPTAIIRLYRVAIDYLANTWAALRHRYDIAELPDDALHEDNALSKAAMVGLVTTVTVASDAVFKADGSKRKDLLHSLSTFLHAVLNSLRPMRLVQCIGGAFWWLFIKVSLRIPLSLFRESFALCGNAEQYPGTMIEWINRYWNLFSSAVKESLQFLHMVYTGPRVLLEELILSHQLPMHHLQTVSLCGRKVVAWSDPVPVELIRKLRDATGVSASEILMNATSAALRDYFRQFGQSMPDNILTTTRFFPEETLLATCRTFEAGTNPSTGGGVLCLALPTSSLQAGDTIAGLEATSHKLRQAKRRQPILYLMSLWQLEKGLLTKILPGVVVRLIFNYLTRRYTVSMTEVATNSGTEATRQTLWGQEVEKAMYWRPPQSNICLSLTVMCYGDTVQLGVMSDALLSPHHLVISSGFHQQLQKLASAAGVPQDPPSTPRSPDQPQ